MLCIRLIGGVAVEADGEPIPAPASRRAWALLGWLALHPGPHSRAKVAARLWPDVLDSSARQSTRSALWSLRQALGSVETDPLISTRDRIGLRPDVDVDVGRFAAHLAAGRLAAAAEIGDGELLAGVDDEWALLAREEHRERLVGVLGALSAQAAEAGDQAAAVRLARRASALDPLSEEAARTLMTRLGTAGDRPAALATYQRLAERLRRELRVSPSEPTWRLAEQIRTRADTTPALRRPVTPMPARPRMPGELPLIGRGADLAPLDAAWSSARDGRGGLAVVHGDPGIGKTRLVAELADTARRDGGYLARGAAPDLGAGALAPWIEVCAALQRQLGELPEAPWVAGLAPLLPAHVRVGPVSIPPGMEQARLSEAMVALLEHCGRRHPVLIVLEDMHAADEGSLSMLSYVSRRVCDLRVLLAATRRERPQRDHLAALEQAQRQRGGLRADVALAPLDGRAVSRLARAVGTLSDEAVHRIVDVADGNALLAVEAARALAAGDDLPLGLRGAARAATARLPEDARNLVRTLAVAGRDLDPVEAALRAEVELSSALPPAEDEGLVSTAGGRLSFRHALLREAVYADMPAMERTARHARAAEQLRAQASLDRAAEAAAHLKAAGRLPEAGRLLVQAAVRARAVGALADATSLLEQASEALPDDPAPALELADVLAWRGRPGDAQAAFALALARLEVAGDASAIAAAHLRYAEWHYGPICQPSVSVQACRRALSVLDGAGLHAPALRAEVLGVYAWCVSIDGDLDEVARALAMLTEVAGERPSDPLLACGADRARSFALLRQGRFAEAVAPGLRSAEAAVRAGRPDLAYAALVNAAFGQAARADLDAALELLDRAADAVGGNGMLAIETHILIDRSWVLARMGRLTDAAEAAAQARRTADRLDAPDLQAVVDAERGRIALRAGDYEAAVTLLAAALAVPDASIGRPLARLQRAEALARLGRSAAAEAELDEVVLEPVRPGDWPDTLVARMSAVQGLIAAGNGDRALATRRLEQAAAGWRRRLSPRELADRMASVLADLGRPIIGLVVPAEELAVIEADLSALLDPTKV
jgi:DNA-binding SARP family transcriptional activator/tetratricopeptide (TPR) repeat protein